jgi:hypothetical protein
MRINHVQLKKAKIILVIIEYKDGALTLVTLDETKLYQCSWNMFYTLQTTLHFLRFLQTTLALSTLDFCKQHWHY